ncbi:hypothetical protein TA3x_003349 [Tundrisphaera sp. TA3]|uniref:hypothetical protein n=1 Tax=Tundrisphaera sp. TA3 TaxID=3435775 RepID=UPI003EC02E56
MAPLLEARNEGIRPMYVVEAHAAYLILSVGLTAWVALTLSRNGRIFLVDAFGGHRELADSVNHLLVVGFLLINVGFAATALKYGDRPTDAATALEVVSTKVGLVLLVLGMMHFFNLWVISKVRRRARLRDLKPPVAPEEITEVVPGYAR